MWKAVSDRDWSTARTLFTDDCVFIDVPADRTIAVKGPDEIVEKLRISLDQLTGYAHHPGLLITDGANAIFEHSETWTWTTGHSALLRFVSVHKVCHGRISYWKDYWDTGG